MRRTENPMTHCDIDDTFLTNEQMLNAFEQFHSPLFVYDEQGLRNRAKSLLSLFSSCKKHYFPLRHCAFSSIYSIIREEGLGAQCQSKEELQNALDAGFAGKDILYCAMTLNAELAHRLTAMDAALMVGSPLALQYEIPSCVYLMCRLPKKRNCLGSEAMERCGVGFLPDELPPIIRLLREKGVAFVGLALRHEGNISDENFLTQRICVMRRLAEKLQQQDCKVDHIHIDGTLGLQYNRVKLCPMNEEAAAASAMEAMKGAEETFSLSLGTFLLEPCAILMSTILDVWQRSCPVIVTDSLLSMLKFRAMERYHHMSIMERPWVENRVVCDVYGDMPVAGEWFGRNRILPLPQPGEHLILHDVGCCVNPHGQIPVLLYQSSGTYKALYNCEE